MRGRMFDNKLLFSGNFYMCVWEGEGHKAVMRINNVVCKLVVCLFLPYLSTVLPRFSGPRRLQSAENRKRRCHRFWLRLRHAVILISNVRTFASKKIKPDGINPDSNNINLLRSKE